MAASDFVAKSKAFLSWFTSLPGVTVHPDVEIQDVRARNAGRGVGQYESSRRLRQRWQHPPAADNAPPVATAPIAQGTILATIPASAILSTGTSDLRTLIPTLFPQVAAKCQGAASDDEQDDDRTGTWLTLILVVMYEVLQGDRSRWKPYLDILPRDFDSLMFWTDNELRELQASAVPGKIGRQQADDMFQAHVLPVIEAHAQVFYPPATAASARLGEEQLLQLYHAVASTIMAYAFDTVADDDPSDSDNGDDEWMEDRGEGPSQMGMVPLADLLNADASFNARVSYGDGGLMVTAVKAIPAGAEILNCYGPLSNGELLRRYGYVTDAHARYDVVEIPSDLLLSEFKAALDLDEVSWGGVYEQIAQRELDHASLIDRELDAPEDGDISPGPTELQKLPADLEDQIQTLLDIVGMSHRHRHRDPSRPRRDAFRLELMRRVLQRRLDQYATSEADDDHLLSRQLVTGRLRMAVLVRRGEKSLLREAIALVRQQQQADVPPS